MLQIELRHEGFPSDLSNQQWDLIKDLLPLTSPVGRPRRVCLRQILNAIFYLNRTGCPWRYLPKNFPNWRTVYDYFINWNRDGVLENIHNQLVSQVRIIETKETKPSLLIIDSQAVKAHWGEDRGYDGFKKIRGRKRSIVVDSLGLVHSVMVDSALIKDHRSAIDIFRRFENKENKVKKVLADGGYRGDFSWLLEKWHGIEVICTASKNRNTNTAARVLIESNLKPTRWVVERTFAWLNHYRRLSRDYEKKAINSRLNVLIAMIQLMLNRLTKGKNKRWGK